MKEMQDPIVKLSSINEVKVNRDHSFAHVYVAHLQTEKTEELVNFLNKNKGFIRSRLAKSVDLYKIPDLIFVADTLYDQGAKIDNIINSWKNKNYWAQGSIVFFISFYYFVFIIL